MYVAVVYLFIKHCYIVSVLPLTSIILSSKVKKTMKIRVKTARKAQERENKGKAKKIVAKKMVQGVKVAKEVVVENREVDVIPAKVIKGMDAMKARTMMMTYG